MKCKSFICILFSGTAIRRANVEIFSPPFQIVRYLERGKISFKIAESF